jgi:hypothetical protein
VEKSLELALGTKLIENILSQYFLGLWDSYGRDNFKVFKDTTDTFFPFCLSDPYSC